MGAIDKEVSSTGPAFGGHLPSISHMDSASWSSSANLFGIVTGSITLLALIFYRSHLPKWRYQGLEEMLKNTEDIWVTESHLLQNWELRENVQEQLVSCVF
jgi:hypothetical protein